METKSRNYNVTELGKAITVKASHTLRIQLESVNVGAMKFASYVANSHSGAFIAESLIGSTAKLSFEKDQSVILCKGNGGSLLRVAQMSTCGKYAMRDSKIVAIGSFGNFAIENRGSIAEFVRSICNGELNAKDHSFRVNKDGALFHGIGICTAGETWQAMAFGYASLVTVINGKLVFVDMETRRNTYNGAVLGVSLSDEVARKAGADLVRSFVGKSATKADGAKLSKAAKAAKAKK